MKNTPPAGGEQEAPKHRLDSASSLPALSRQALCALVALTAIACSRNSTGTYSLPTGNPVTTGTTVSSSWANNTLSDIGTEVTNSLDRAGRGAMTGSLQLSSGTVSAPGLVFSAETNSGLYRAASHDVRFSLNGVDMQKWDGTTTTFTGGSAGAAITGVGGATSGQGASLQGTGTGVGLFSNGGGGTTTLAATVAHTSGATGAGVVAASNTSGSHGVVGWGTGAGSGLYGIAGSSGFGAELEGNLRFRNSNPSSSTAFTNTATPANVPKAWALISTNGSGACTVTDGFNLTSCSVAAGGTVTVTFASNFSNANYAVFGTASRSGPKVFYVASTAVGSMTFNVYNADFTTQTDCSTLACTVSYQVLGHQ
jgi:hypothetical protein